MPPPSSWRIEGRATLTTTASSVITKKPSTAAASVQRKLERPRTPASLAVLLVTTGVVMWCLSLQPDCGDASGGAWGRGSESASWTPQACAGTSDESLVYARVTGPPYPGSGRTPL